MPFDGLPPRATSKTEHEIWVRGSFSPAADKAPQVISCKRLSTMNDYSVREFLFSARSELVLKIRPKLASRHRRRQVSDRPSRPQSHPPLVPITSPGRTMHRSTPTRSLLSSLALVCLSLCSSAQNTFVFDQEQGVFPTVIYQGDDSGNVSPLFSLPDVEGIPAWEVESDGQDIYSLACSGYDERDWIHRGAERWHLADGWVLAVDDSFVYYQNRDLSMGRPIIAVNKGSHAETVLFQTNGTVFDLEVANGNVFWVHQEEGGAAISRNGEYWASIPSEEGASVGLAVTANERVLVFYRSGGSTAVVQEVFAGGTTTTLMTFDATPCLEPSYASVDLEAVVTDSGELRLYTASAWSSDMAYGVDDVVVHCSPRTGGGLGVHPTEGVPSCPAPLSIPYAGMFRRVDIHGIPMPEMSPTQTDEVDREALSVYVDAFSLSPQLSSTDVQIPMEGGDLRLEFRRTSGVRSYRWSSLEQNQVITYPSDRILGPGWDTNLSSRVVIAEAPCENDLIATVVDETGTSYRYMDNGLTGRSNPFSPETYYSLNNQASRATCYRADANTLVLEKPFGFVLTFERLGTFFHPSGGTAGSEDYYRLASVTDRNSNAIIYEYLSDDPTERGSFHVERIFEAAHPERQITFEYAFGTGGNGNDWGDRLQTVTDALGRQTTYEYGASGGHAWNFLAAITREQVFDGEAEAPAIPRTEYSYHAAELAVEETTDPDVEPPTDPLIRNRFVGLASVTDPRGHVTQFSYTDDYAPSSITATEYRYAPRIHLDGLTTDDGSVSLSFVSNDHESVVTQVTDTRSNLVTFDFSAEPQPAANLVGSRLTVTQLTRTSAIGSVTYTWSDDEFSNLLDVVDINGNGVSFSYDTEVARHSNQPTEERMTDVGSGETITTAYEYGVFSRRQGMLDGEGMQTAHLLDAQGNRFQVEGELGQTTEYTYDPDGFLNRVIDPDGRRTDYSRSFTPLGP